MRSSISSGRSSSGKSIAASRWARSAGQPLRPLAIEAAQLAVELAQSLAALRLGLGRGEVGDRLGLGQVELAVQKGAAGEFAGLGEAQPEPAECRDHRGEHGAAAVQMELGDILAGKARRRRKPQDQRVVERLAGRRIDEPAAPGRARRRQFAGEQRHRPRGIRSGQPQNGNGGTPCRRRRCENRVAVVQPSQSHPFART